MMTCNALERTKRRVARVSGGEYIDVRYVLVDMQTDNDDATSSSSSDGSDDDDDDVAASGGGKKDEDGGEPKKKKRRRCSVRYWV